jgi:hypothetical protein
MGSGLTSEPGAMNMGEKSKAFPAGRHVDRRGFLKVSTAAAAVGLYARGLGGCMPRLVATIDAEPI